MTPKFIKYYCICVLLVVVTGCIILYNLLPGLGKYKGPATADDLWDVPDIYSLGTSPQADLIRYGRELIVNTARYLGPKGTVASISNGMNCENCHLEAGTRLNGNCFAMVATGYPKFRPRSGRVESVEFRVNECFERSLNGKPLDSLSKEMRSIVAYLLWLGKDVKKDAKLKGMGIPDLELLPRAASATNGQKLFAVKCVKCHGQAGEGLLQPDSTGYVYPPLWGPHSYNVSAGIYRISRLAGYIKYNMPYTKVQEEPQLTDEEAWDLAAFINSNDRPQKLFPYDWPSIAAKPFDYPFGPYTDSFPITQHKYGPFAPIKKLKAGK